MTQGAYKFGGLVIALLAAGSARRFGGGKLDAPLGGKALGRHALDQLVGLGLGQPLIVVGKPVPEFARQAADEGIAQLLPNPDAESGLGSSVAIAAYQAQQMHCSRLLLVLADMPLVTADSLRALVALASPGRPAAMQYPEGRPGIPCCVPKDMLALMTSHDGQDRGASSLLRQIDGLRLVEPAGDELRDVDVPADLLSMAMKLAR